MSERATPPGIADRFTLTGTHRDRPDLSVEHWALGFDTYLTLLSYDGIAVASLPHRERAAQGHLRQVSVAVLAAGDWWLRIDGRSQLIGSDSPTLVVVNHQRPLDFRNNRRGSIVALHTLSARLMLSENTIDRAITHLGPSVALYPLAVTQIQHLGMLARTAPALLPELNVPTVALIRSLLLNAAATGGSPSESNLVAVIEKYIDDNIRDSSMSPATIAAAHHISVRQLYKIWPADNTTVSSYITRRRVESACAALVSEPHLSIAALAHRHGFVDPTHFARRFREAYGTTPSRFRAGDRRTQLPR